METSTFTFDISVLRYIPSILVWGAALVLAIIMLKRGGGKAEKLLLSGCVIMFLVQLIAPVFRELIIPFIDEQGMSPQTIGWFNIPSAIFGLAGLVLLIIAFWTRFHRKKQETA